MSRHDLFDRIVGRLNAATLRDVEWAAPASLINEIIGTHANNLAITQGPSAAGLVFSFVQSCYGRQRDRDCEQRYLTHFFHRDEAVSRIVLLPDGQLTPVADLYTEQEKKTSPVYNESRKTQNGLYVRLVGPVGAHVVWGIADSTQRGGGWSSTQIEMIECLRPHVRHFARVRAALAEARALGSSLGELLNNGRLSVIQLDRRGRIVAANDRARGLLAKRAGLSDRGGFLRASAPGDNDALQRVLARALPPFGVQASPGSMTIGCAAVRTRLAMHVTPVVERAWDPRGQDVAALVLVVDPKSRPRIDAWLVAEALNLTPAESQLATLVAAGRTVREIAEMTGRSEGTVRWHLKRIFRKQGISQQADLVRRVLSLEGLPGSRRPAEH